MQETELYSSQLTAELPIGQSVELNNNLFKVRRKGDKIYQVDDENVTMLNNAPPSPPLQNQSAKSTELEVDDVASGESLYKTFSFDKALCKEETEKCIAFWRGIVEKNLEPIKCTLIGEANNQTTLKKDKKKKKKNLKQSTSEGEKEAAPKENIWFQILHELQKKKLHQTKLMMEKRCQFCEYLKGEYETDDPQKDVKKEFQELDEWAPRRNTKLRLSSGRIMSQISYKDASGRKQSVGSKTKRGSSFAAASAADGPTEADLYNSESLVNSVKEEAKLIEFVDAIQEKQKNGSYSQWRENQLKQRCACAQGQCRCDTNPAVVAIQQESLRASDVTVENEPKSILHLNPKPASLHNRRISVLLRCTCSKSSCDCHLSPEPLEKEPIDDQPQSPAPVKSSKGSLKTSNSLELARKRLSVPK
ncbi:uncharacterized protein LOC143200323 [Rhynchophorus ferrugineus]|uniref:uncharacterized protein LOC143200323 n=1 Tax=Rhynchophorus ferrugineus TaxID=354439 RepID=UPI003FCDEA5A